MNYEQFLAVSTVIGLLLTYLNARTTASSGAIGALSQTIEALRGEVESERLARKTDKTQFELDLSQEVKKREEMGKSFDRERARLLRYIKELIARMDAAKIDVPELEEPEQ